MRKVLVTIIVAIFLSACSSSNSTAPKRHTFMDVNGNKVEYDEDVMKIVGKRSTNTPKIGLTKEDHPRYTIKVDNLTYTVFDFPTAVLVQEIDKNGKIMYQFVITRDEYKKLSDLLE